MSESSNGAGVPTAAAWAHMGKMCGLYDPDALYLPGDVVHAHVLMRRAADMDTWEMVGAIGNTPLRHIDLDADFSEPE